MTDCLTQKVNSEFLVLIEVVRIKGSGKWLKFVFRFVWNMKDFLTKIL